MPASVTPPTHGEKTRISLDGWLLGKGFTLAMKAMNEAEALHDGMRKDGVTPEFSHQIWIANFLRTLPLPDDALRVLITAAFFHDTPEDKGMSFREIEDKYGPEVTDVVERMTKEFRGIKMDPNVYFERLALSGLAALLKGVDRIHNLSTMVGVFSFAKQIEYLAETERHHLPMLRLARKRFPEYRAAFENVKHMLLSHVTLIRGIHAASQASA